ncbi:LysM peptidoglycan-binding domain-containing protein [Neobacillus pocheonensis]|uniref:LysM peptidoglycan-binding domain-containing protein n=1 Tax=Neobacillus pocheonensis TaxID=363869 RepID=A0ABT0W7A1_9BACI|nr:LysM peptidoglycan-binding domain-containing protein [Neobacillus pocheonensis]
MALHVVGSGENLWSISKLYGVSVSSIITINGLLSASNIVPGLALYIPDNLPPVRFYKIKAGDQIWQMPSNLARIFL